MKLKNILKTTGALHILLGLLIIFLLIFSVETIAGKASTETLLLVRGTADVVAASNLGIGCLLIICSSIKDKASLRKVLSGELALMFCFLAVALFNTFNAGTIVDGGPPSTIVPALKVLNRAIAKKQNIKTNSPDKTFLREVLSFMELQIINKQPIPKLLAATTSAVPLTRSNVSFEALPAMVSTENISKKIINNPNKI